MARVATPSSLAGAASRRFCAYCFACLTNGAAFCSEICEDGAWDIVPTINGRIW
jgi:hypothetical protein